MEYLIIQHFMFLHAETVAMIPPTLLEPVTSNYPFDLIMLSASALS